MVNELAANHDQVGNNLAKAFSKRQFFRIKPYWHEGSCGDCGLTYPAECIDTHLARRESDLREPP